MATRRLVTCCVLCVLLAGCGSPGRPRPTSAPQPTATPTALPTPTPSTALRDPLDGPEGSQVRRGATTSGRFAFVDGRYAITVTSPNSLVWSSVGGVYDDVAVDVDVIFGEDVGTTNGAVLFRMRDDQNFYALSISGDGYYALDAREDGAWRSLIEWTPWPAIDIRGGANRLGVTARANRISIFLNGELLGETVDAAFAEGSVALAVNTYEISDITVYFDNLAVTPEQPQH